LWRRSAPELWWLPFVVATEVGRFAFFCLLLPLYSRLKRDKLLDNFTRGRIYGHIENHPGVHYSELLRDLNLGNGTLAYHLKTLESENMIRTVREGQYRLFFPKTEAGRQSMKRFDPLVKKANKQISGTRLSIRNLISSTPGLSETEIAQWLNISKQTVHYHIREMESMHMIKVHREGNSTRCFPNLEQDGPTILPGEDAGESGSVSQAEEFKPT
jgi:predicted transcriptional regulator